MINNSSLLKLKFFLLLALLAVMTSTPVFQTAPVLAQDEDTEVEVEDEPPEKRGRFSRFFGFLPFQGKIIKKTAKTMTGTVPMSGILRLDKRLMDLVHRLKNLEDPIQGLDKPIQGLQTPLSQISVPLSKLPRPLEKLDTSISSLLGPIDNLNQPINDLKKPIDNLLKPINNLEKPIKDIGTPLNTLNTEMRSLKQPISGLEKSTSQKMNVLANEMGGIRGTLETLNKPVVEVIDPLKDLPVQVRYLGDQIAALKLLLVMVCVAISIAIVISAVIIAAAVRKRPLQQ